MKIFRLLEIEFQKLKVFDFSSSKMSNFFLEDFWDQSQNFLDFSGKSIPPFILFLIYNGPNVVLYTPNSVWTIYGSGIALPSLFLYQLAPLQDDQQHPLLDGG